MPWQVVIFNIMTLENLIAGQCFVSIIPQAFIKNKITVFAENTNEISTDFSSEGGVNKTLRLPWELGNDEKLITD